MLNRAYKSRIDALTLPAIGMVPLAIVPQARAPRLLEIGPDSGLLAAWNRYLDSQEECARIDAADDGNLVGEDVGTKFFNEHVAPAAALVCSMPAKTPEGLAVKTRYLFMAIGEEKGHYDAIIRGAPITNDLISDARYRLLWTMIGDAERMAVPPSPAVSVAGPDAAIFQAWADYKARRAAYLAAPHEVFTADGMEDRMVEDIDEAEVRILTSPAVTLEGLATKLRTGFLAREDITKEQCEAVLNGCLPTMDALDDRAAQEALSVLLDVERMIKRPATDTAIQQAWADYLAAQAAYNSTDEFSFDELCEVECKFLDIPVNDFAGAALRLRWLLEMNATPDTQAIILSGVPLVPEMFPDCSERATVKLILDVERLAAGPAGPATAVVAPPLRPIEARLRTLEFNEGSTEADDDEREQQVNEWSSLTDQLIRTPGAAVTKLIVLIRNMERGNLADACRGEMQDYQLAVGALRDIQTAGVPS